MTNEGETLHGQVDDYSQSEFDAWCQGIERALADSTSPLALQVNGTLIDLDIDGDGDMRVHYDERLISLIREVRSSIRLLRRPSMIDRRAGSGAVGAWFPHSEGSVDGG